MLARGGDAVHVSADECVELVALLGRWHADEGVLPADLSDLRDAVTAAALRQDAVRRQDGTSSAGRSRCSLEPRQRERPLVGFSPANAGAAASGLSRERKGGGSLMVALSGLAPAFRSIVFAWEGRPNR